MTTYTLAELALLFNNEKWLRQELGPYHELRPDGIFVAPEWQSESYRDEHLPGVQLNLPKTRILDAVLPAEFTEGQLLAFLAIRTDLAYELERHYTNDKPEGCSETSALRLQERRLASLEVSLPAFADMLRRRLPRGAHWYLDTATDLTGSVSSADPGTGLLHAGQTAALEQQLRASIGRNAANKRHAPSRDAKALVLTWWAEHKTDRRSDGKPGTITREQAADAIVAARLVSETRTTVRDWLKGA